MKTLKSINNELTNLKKNVSKKSENVEQLIEKFSSIEETFCKIEYDSLSWSEQKLFDRIEEKMCFIEL